MMQEIQQKQYSNTGNADVLKLVNTAGYVLDIGCGTGDIARHLKERGCRVDGITISEAELAQANRFLSSGYLFNIEQGLPESVKYNKYDFIICSHVLEHICYPEHVLQDIKNCLHTNGKLIIALPNLFHYASRWKLIKGEFNYNTSGIWDNTHFKWYTFETGKTLLEKNGFTVTNRFVTGQLPLNSLFSKILSEKISTAVYNQIKKIAPGLLGYQLVYVAQNPNP